MTKSFAPAGSDAPPRKYKTFIEVAHTDAPAGMLEIEAESCYDAAQNRVILLNQAIDAKTPGLSDEVWFVLVVVGPSLFADDDGNREEIAAAYFVTPRNCRLTKESPVSYDDEAVQLGLIPMEEAYGHIPGVVLK